MEPNTSRDHNGPSIPVHAVHELIGRTLMHPELKELLTKKLVSRSHGQSLKASEVETIFQQIKMERAGSSDALHIEQLHKNITQHFGGNTHAAPHEPPSHPFLPRQ